MTNPDETIAYMQQRPEPWIAFKILVAGALEPETGVSVRLRERRRFICVGMYDFQVVDDVNLALDVLRTRLARQREWRA